MTYGEAFTVQPSNDLPTTISLTGDQPLAVPEQQYALARPTVLQPAGLTCTVDPDAPLGSRVSAVEVTGAPLDPTASCRVTVNDLLAGGGDGFTTLRAGTDPVNSGLDIDASTDHLSAGAGLSTRPDGSRVTPAAAPCARPPRRG